MLNTLTLAALAATPTLSLTHFAAARLRGAVDGTLKLANGKTRAFCEVYDFENAKGEKVREITSYVIEIN